MSAGFLSLVPAVISWVAVAYKLPAFKRNLHDPAIRAFWLSLFFLALALTLLLPTVALWIDQATRFSNLSRLLGNETVLVAAWAVQIFVFLNLDYRQDGVRSRVRLASWALVGVLIAMSTLFALAPVHHETADFWQRYSRAPFMLEYRLVFLAYLGLAVMNIMRHSWRYAGVSEQPSLSLGLRLVAVGGLLGGGYVAHEGVRSFAVAIGVHNAFLDSDTATRLLIASSVACMTAGVTMPAWGSRFGISAIYKWLERYGTYRQLYPLWSVLYRATPEIGLLPPKNVVADAFTLRDLEFRLYRRIVEIRDGILALRLYTDAHVIQRAQELSQAARLPANEVRATVEAASLAAALEMRKQDSPSHAVPPSFDLYGGPDIRSEASVLVAVARSFRHSPIVRAVVKQTRRQQAAASSGAQLPASRR
jgi:hypothetical protein